MDTSSLTAYNSNPFQDSLGADWPSESIYDQNPHFSDPDFDSDYNSLHETLMPTHRLDTPSPIIVDDALPEPYGADLQRCNIDSIGLPSSTEGKRTHPALERNIFDGLFTFDNFSTTSSPDINNLPSLTSTVNSAAVERYPVLDNLWVSVEKICTVLERFSERLNDASTLIDRVQLQTKIVSNSTTAAIDGFNGKVDGLSVRIDGLVETVEEIVKRECIAMEKFGNFAGQIHQPTPSLGSEPGVILHRRGSD